MLLVVVLEVSAMHPRHRVEAEALKSREDLAELDAQHRVGMEALEHRAAEAFLVEDPGEALVGSLGVVGCKSRQ